MMGAISDVLAVFGRWRTWFLMANQDIKMRYRRSLLGPFWISLSMAVMVLGLALLYGRIFDQEFHAFLYWLACGFLAWFFISGLISDGMQIAIEAEPQLRSISIPLPVLAARMLMRNAIVFLHNLVVIVALIALFGLHIHLQMLMAIPGLILIACVGFFCALTLGPLCLRFRDVTQVVANILQISFFLTPIIWKPDQGRVPMFVIEANPFYHLLEIVRAPLLGEAASMLNWTVSLSVLAGLTMTAWLTLSVARRKIYVWL